MSHQEKGFSMIRTIQDKEGNNRFQIRPHPDGLCFEVWEWKGEHKGRGRGTGKTIPAGWIFTGRYPSTLEHAYRTVGEFASLRGENEEVQRWCSRVSKREGEYLDGWITECTQGKR
jgi:hypothetical protein